MNLAFKKWSEVKESQENSPWQHAEPSDLTEQGDTVAEPWDRLAQHPGQW